MALVKVTMLRSAAGPHGILRKGGTYEVEENFAHGLARMGICRVIAAKPTRPPAQKEETEPQPKPRTTGKRGRPRKKRS